MWCGAGFQSATAEKSHGAAEKLYGAAEKYHGAAEKYHGAAEKSHAVGQNYYAAPDFFARPPVATKGTQELLILNS